MKQYVESKSVFMAKFKRFIWIHCPSLSFLYTVKTMSEKEYKKRVKDKVKQGR